MIPGSIVKQSSDHFIAAIVADYNDSSATTGSNHVVVQIRLDLQSTHHGVAKHDHDIIKHKRVVVVIILDL